ncbi:MAG: MFS transporter [Alphaproteobacteria bacterium]|nr:MAG: MFS transporter [Alphaproteobacteria bacterium]
MTSASSMPATPAPLSRVVMLMILCGAVVSLVTFGIRAAFGLFLVPMSAEFGWGRDVFSDAMAISNLLFGAAQPVAGAIADRYGARRVLLAGITIYAAGTVLMVQASSPMLLHLTGGVLTGIGIGAGSFAIIMAALGKVVPPERRTWVFGMMTAANSMGQLLVPPLAQLSIDVIGWQTTLVAMAGALVLILPLLLPLLAPTTASAPAPTQGPSTLRTAIKEAWGDRSYRLLTAGFFVCGFHVAFVQVHLPPYIKDAGLPSWLAAASLALIGGFNIIGSYIAGVMGGRGSKRNMLAWIYGLRAVVFALFVLAGPSVWSVVLFAAVLGLLWLSTVPPTSGLVAQIYGTRYMSTLFGLVFFSHQVGAFIGLTVGGRLYEATGSYDITWWLSVALGLFAALVHIPIDERPLTKRLAAAE